MELVHAHIAKTPVSPFERGMDSGLDSGLEPTILRVISDIVMKLLQKNPEDRYQSINGILYDLEWCLNHVDVETHGRASLQIGVNDFSAKFQKNCMEEIKKLFRS